MAGIEVRAALANRPEGEYEMLSLQQRVQHWVLIFSFVLLVVTGLALRYSQTPAAATAIAWMGGIGARYVLHRVGAVLLAGICIYHLGYVMFSERGGRDFRRLMFARKDISDVIQMLKFFFGLAKEKPRFGRFGYLEKFEYFSMGWGSLVMIGTGLVLWFPEASMMFLPKWMLDIARVIHSWEAMLAFLAIIIWHMYNVHLNPSSFPMSRVWLTGRISLEELKERHPLEYEEVIAARR